MRTFHLHRREDISGVTGVGVVAEGIEFSDGTVALRWFGEARSTAIWADIDEAMTVHGHGGLTTVVWDDADTTGEGRGSRNANGAGVRNSE